MKFTLLILYRPLSKQAKHSVLDQYQDDDYIWHTCPTKEFTGVFPPFKEIIIENCLKSIRKNSVFHHKIILASEPNVIFNEKYKKELINKYGDVEFFSSSICDIYNRHKTLANTSREAILSRSDNEFVCYLYLSDTICNKYWDKYISEAIQQYGDDKVFVPLWVEPRVYNFIHTTGIGEEAKKYEIPDELTSDNIWNKWRQYVCNALTIKPPTDRNYYIEKDLDDWSGVCNQANKGCIVENCGDRCYGYYACMIAKNSILKAASPHLLDHGPDLAFDNNLNTKKVVVTRAHMFHLHNPIILDNTEVMHED